MIPRAMTISLLMAGAAIAGTLQAGAFLNTNDVQRSNDACGTEVISTIAKVLMDVEALTMFLIYDNADEDCVSDLMKTSLNGTTTQVLHYSNVHLHLRPFIKKLVLEENMAFMKRSLNVVVLCGYSCINETLKQSIQMDIDVGHRSVLRHFSKWILVPTEMTSYMEMGDLNFDNVALLSTDQVLSTLSISTLLWKETGREWDDVHGQVSMETIFPNTNFGLNGRKLIASALEWLPFSKKVRNHNGTLYSGLSGDIMEYLSNNLNFSYEYVEPPDLLWGHRLDNGTWTGIVGMLQRQTADLSSVPYAFNIERSKVMSFTYPILMEHSTVLYKKAEDRNKMWKVLISCFKWNVYGVGGGVLVAIMLTYLILTKCTSHPGAKKLQEKVYTDSLLVGVYGALQQGARHPPVFLSGQVLFGFWMVFCMLMTTVYRGNLMAFLTVDRLYVPFKTIQELADQDLYEVGTPVGSYLALTIKSSTQPVMKTLWEKISATHAASPQTGEGDYEYQLRRLYEGQFAYIQSSVAAEVIMSESCELTRINEYFLPTTSSMVFPLHSPLARIFHPQIMIAIESGLYEKWYETWVPRPKVCSDDSVIVGMSPLHREEYYSALAACGVGIVLALIVLLLETFLNELIPRNAQKGKT